MKKNLAALLFILLSTFGLHTNTETIGISLAKEHIEIPKRIDGVTTIRLPDENKTKISKKDLKNEIKRRKKYHKALLNTYNESFTPKYLELIAENSEKLSYLRELLQA